MDVLVDQVLDVGDDVLVVRGRVVDDDSERELEGRGWVSALTHHFDDDAYDPETWHRRPDAVARERTGAEKLEYCRSLLLDAHRATLPDVGGRPLDPAAWTG